VADWVVASGRFTLNQLPSGSKSLIRHFSRGFEPDSPAFEGLALREVLAAGPVLAGSLAYLDAEVAAHVDGGDHRIVVGRVIAGAVFDRDHEPFVHIRQNGMHY
jgi:flavin reductase (DIM6/NTAB) family NADH-FMN oxidoreductase RutF